MKQLEARELRIGNYVQYGGDIVRITEISTHITNQVGFVLDNGDIYRAPIEELEAVPLNEEWLEKAGCEKQSEDWYRLKITRRGVLEFYTPDGTIQVQIANKSGHSFGFVKIEYVHQLQNLYYALTGEELTLSGNKMIEMEQGKYYLTICDDYKGHMRKTLIYIISVSKDKFKFKVADWKADKQGRMVVHIHYPNIEQGDLTDSECFKRVKETHIVDMVNPCEELTIKER